MRVTATKLRQNVYAILDEVLEKGIPVEVERKGRILKIVPERKKDIWERLAALPEVVVGDPKDLESLEVKWLDHWREPQNLADLERISRTRKARETRKRKPR